MDRITKYSDVICAVLAPYGDIKYGNAEIKNRLVTDKVNHQYLVISEGWQANHHYHNCLIHIEIIGEKIWVQCDNTEDGITNELVVAGIEKDHIVLGFQEPSVRQYTGFAVA
jgi:XisI protein